MDRIIFFFFAVLLLFVRVAIPAPNDDFFSSTCVIF